MTEPVPADTLAPPVSSLPPVPRRSVRKWASCYAALSAIHSLNALILSVIVVSVHGEGVDDVVSEAAGFATFFYFFGLPVALFLALATAHLLVSVMPGHEHALRPTFAVVALVAGWLPVGSFVIAGEAPVSLGLLALVANLAAVWRVWEKVGPAPESGRI